MGAIKYSTGTVSNTLKLGNFVVGNDNVAYGPTSVTGFYSTIDAPNGGYVIYGNKSSQGPSIYVCQNDSELITISSAIAGQSFTTVAQCIEYFNSQSGSIIVDRDIPNIVTSGLVLYLDAGMISSYGRSGTSWVDLTGNSNSGTLSNGVSYENVSGGVIRTDGANESITSNFNNRGTTYNTVEMFFRWRTGTGGMFIGFQSYDVYTVSGHLGFNTAASDVYGINSTKVNSLNLVGTTNLNWHHYVFVFSDQVQKNKIYIDGQLQTLSQQIGTTNLTTTRSFSSTLKLSGWTNNTGYSINGDYSYVSIYNRELSQVEILQNYQATFTRFLGENIVTKGLVLYLDAGYLPSYPTTGTTWYDVSGLGNNGTLTNGPTYNSGDGGSIVFDGVDDVLIPKENTLNYSPGTTGELSLEIWVYPTGPFSNYIEGTVTNLAGLFGQSYFNNSIGWGLGITTISGVGNCFQFQVRNLSTIVGTGVNVNGSGYATFTNGNWYHVVGSFTRNSISRLYVNGELKSSLSSTSLNGLSLTPNLNDAAIGQIRNTFYAGCRVSTARLYNRPLSAAEVLQNFNAQKSRFGL